MVKDLAFLLLTGRCSVSSSGKWVTVPERIWVLCMRRSPSSSAATYFQRMLPLASDKTATRWLIVALGKVALVSISWTSCIPWSNLFRTVRNPKGVWTKSPTCTSLIATSPLDVCTSASSGRQRRMLPATIQTAASSMRMQHSTEVSWRPIALFKILAQRS